MKLIQLNGKHGAGKFTLVDDEYYEWLSQWKWRCLSEGYVVRGRKSILIHRQIMKTPGGLLTDHEDHNKLNNQKYNLRICTNSQNMMNKKKQPGCTSKYKGVGFSEANKKWYARIEINEKKKHLGYFINEKDAAIVYNEAAIKLFGGFARLNFLDK